MVIIAVIVALLMVNGVAVVGATVTGQQKELCENVLKGQYTPAPYPENVCPGGEWVNLYKVIKEEQPKPK